MKQIILQGEMLTDIWNGIYTQTTWYDDGSIETRYVPMGKIFVPGEEEVE